MFDLSWGHFIVVAIVALIVIGPKELPAVLRTIGQWTTKIRRMAAEFQGQFQEAMREAEMADLKKEISNISDTARGVTSQLNDPMNWEPKPADAVTPPESLPREPLPSDFLSAEPFPPGESPAAEPPAPAALDAAAGETPDAGQPAAAVDVAAPPASPLAPDAGSGEKSAGDRGVHQ